MSYKQEIRKQVRHEQMRETPLGNKQVSINQVWYYTIEYQLEVRGKQVSKKTSDFETTE